MARKYTPRIPPEDQPDGHSVLTPRQFRFCEAYVIHLNQAKAAREAGYASSRAKEAGFELMGLPHVQAKIAELAEVHRQAVNLSAERVLLELARIAFADPRRLFDVDQRMKHPRDWDDDIAAAVSSLEVDDLWGVDANGDKGVIGQRKKVRFWSKTAATDQLGRHLRLFAETVTQGQEVSALLKAVLMEFQSHRDRLSTPEAEWAPYVEGEGTPLPALPEGEGLSPSRVPPPPPPPW